MTKRETARPSDDSGLRLMNALTLNSPAIFATNCVLIGHLANRAYGSRRMFPHDAYRWPLSATVSGRRDKPSEKNAHGRQS